MPTFLVRHRRQLSLVALGEAIRRVRLAAGMSQEELALRAEIDRGYMGGIERGESFHLSKSTSSAQADDPLDNQPKRIRRDQQPHANLDPACRLLVRKGLDVPLVLGVGDQRIEDAAVLAR